MKSRDFVYFVKLGFAQMTFVTRVTVLALLAAGLSAPLAAQVSVTISPSLVTMATMATQSFTATVTGSSNTAVTWQVNGVTGGNSTNGLLSTTVLGTANEALYLLVDAMDALYPEDPDEHAERSLARILDRIANASEIPAAVLAFELERLRAWRKAEADAA